MDFYRRISERARAVTAGRKAVACGLALAVAVSAGAVVGLGHIGHTQTGVAYCGYDDHEHTAACYAVPLACAFDGEGAAVLHSHTDPCYAPDGSLICGLPELAAHVHTDACYQEGEGHYAHDDSCYEDVKTLTCPLEETPYHVHSVDDGCYGDDGALTCEKREIHVHGGSCYDGDELVCKKDEVRVHEHSDECYRTDYRVLTCTKSLDAAAPVQLHVHGPACYETAYGEELTCGLEESAGHAHGLECYSPKAGSHAHTADCYVPVEKHEHSDACYETVPGKLTCEREETEGHAHDENCYPLERKLTCDIEESEDVSILTCGLAVEDEKRDLICSLAETEGHMHNDGCLDADGNAVCGLDETPAHAHNDDCYNIIPGHAHDENCYEIIAGHKHDESCYGDVRGDEPACGLIETEAHSHSREAGCYAEDEKLLTCRVETDGDHVHTDACHASVRGALTCIEIESAAHRHNNDCYESVDILLCGNELVCGEAVETGHVHDDSCRAEIRGGLICDLPESEGHAHDENCYGEDGALACTIPEADGHMHDSDCYGKADVLLCENELICDLEESEGHRHDGLCRKQEAVLTCGKEAGEPEAVPGCGFEELEVHAHTSACYMKADGMHVHGDECYMETESGARILACGELAASDCEAGPDGLVIACGRKAVTSHDHTDACLGEAGPDAEPVCGRHVHDADCYIDPTSGLFHRGEGTVTCPVCGEEDIHVHVSGSETCGEEAAEPVLTCGDEDHEHSDACRTYYPDCAIGDHVCAGTGEDVVDEAGDPEDMETPEMPVEYVDYHFEGDGFTVTAGVPDNMFDVPVVLKAERQEKGSDGWLRYMEAVGADPESDEYMLVVDIWFEDESGSVVVPDTSKGEIRVTAVATDDDGNENSADAVWSGDGEADAGSDAEPEIWPEEPAVDDIGPEEPVYPDEIPEDDVETAFDEAA